MFIVVLMVFASRLIVMGGKNKEEVPAMNEHEYFTWTNLVKIENAITSEP